MEDQAIKENENLPVVNVEFRPVLKDNGKPEPYVVRRVADNADCSRVDEFSSILNLEVPDVPVDDSILNDDNYAHKGKWQENRNQLNIMHNDANDVDVSALMKLAELACEDNEKSLNRNGNASLRSISTVGRDISRISEMDVAGISKNSFIQGDQAEEFIGNEIMEQASQGQCFLPIFNTSDPITSDKKICHDVTNKYELISKESLHKNVDYQSQHVICVNKVATNEDDRLHISQKVEVESNMEVLANSDLSIIESKSESRIVTAPLDNEIVEETKIVDKFPTIKVPEVIGDDVNHRGFITCMEKNILETSSAEKCHETIDGNQSPVSNKVLDLGLIEEKVNCERLAVPNSVMEGVRKSMNDSINKIENRDKIYNSTKLISEVDKLSGQLAIDGQSKILKSPMQPADDISELDVENSIKLPVQLDCKGLKISDISKSENVFNTEFTLREDILGESTFDESSEPNDYSEECRGNITKESHDENSIQRETVHVDSSKSMISNIDDLEKIENTDKQIKIIDEPSKQSEVSGNVDAHHQSQVFCTNASEELKENYVKNSEKSVSKNETGTDIGKNVESKEGTKLNVEIQKQSIIKERIKESESNEKCRDIFKEKENSIRIGDANFEKLQKLTSNTNEINEYNKLRCVPKLKDSLEHKVIGEVFDSTEKIRNEISNKDLLEGDYILDGSTMDQRKIENINFSFKDDTVNQNKITDSVLKNKELSESSDERTDGLNKNSMKLLKSIEKIKYDDVCKVVSIEEINKRNAYNPECSNLAELDNEKHQVSEAAKDNIDNVLPQHNEDSQKCTMIEQKEWSFLKNIRNITPESPALSNKEEVSETNMELENEQVILDNVIEQTKNSKLDKNSDNPIDITDKSISKEPSNLKFGNESNKKDVKSLNDDSVTILSNSSKITSIDEASIDATKNMPDDDSTLNLANDESCISSLCKNDSSERNDEFSNLENLESTNIKLISSDSADHGKKATSVSPNESEDNSRLHIKTNKLSKTKFKNCFDNLTISGHQTEIGSLEKPKDSNIQGIKKYPEANKKKLDENDASGDSDDDASNLIIIENESELPVTKKNLHKETEIISGLKKNESITIGKQTLEEQEEDDDIDVCEIITTRNNKPVKDNSGKVEIKDRRSWSEKICDITSTWTTFVCTKCQQIWNISLLGKLFDGNEPVTVNSRISYGAIILIIKYARTFYPRNAMEVSKALLNRADLITDLADINLFGMSLFIVEQLSEKKIECCSLFKLPPRYNKSQIAGRKSFDDAMGPILFSTSRELWKDVNLSNVEENYVKYTSKKKKADLSVHDFSTFSDIIQHINSSNMQNIFRNVLLTEYTSLRGELLGMYKQYLSNLPNYIQLGSDHVLSTFEDLKILCKPFLEYGVSSSEFYKFIFQVYINRDIVLLIPNSEYLHIVIKRRIEEIEKKFTVIEEDEIWDADEIYTGKYVKFYGDDLQSVQAYPTVREILTIFCLWRTSRIRNCGPIVSLSDRILALFRKKIKSSFDVLGLCIRLYAKYSRLAFELDEPFKAKVFLDLYYLPSNELYGLKSAVISPEISFLPSSTKDLDKLFDYYEHQVYSSDARDLKQILPDNIVSCQIKQTQKIRSKILSQFGSNPKIFENSKKSEQPSNRKRSLESPTENNSSKKIKKLVEIPNESDPCDPINPAVIDRLFKENVKISKIPMMITRIYRDLLQKPVPEIPSVDVLNELRKKFIINNL